VEFVSLKYDQNNGNYLTFSTARFMERMKSNPTAMRWDLFNLCGVVKLGLGLFSAINLKT